MRKWLTKTILIPLTRDIDKANQLLVAHGHTDIVLGSASLSFRCRTVFTPLFSRRFRNNAE